jgi:hypothetical protein
MSTVMIRCPTTGKSFSAGIDTDRATFHCLRDSLARSRCPHCGLEHVWWTREAWLEGEDPQGQGAIGGASPPPADRSEAPIAK